MTATSANGITTTPNPMVLDRAPPWSDKPLILFRDRTPIHPYQRLILETGPNDLDMRVLDLLTPIGKGQRGLLVAPPRTGKTVLLQKMARSILRNHPECQVFVLLLDERPEEVTDIREKVQEARAEVIGSTFDREPGEHRKAAEAVLQRAKRLVENDVDVVILLDSLTRLARACNTLAPTTAKTLTGGIAAGALDWPRQFFGSARQFEERGSLTILATMLIDTGSRMDEVIFEEFKGTGNMELHLDRHLADRRIFPAVHVGRSGTRREELLLRAEDLGRLGWVHKALSGRQPGAALEMLLARLKRTRSNEEFLRGQFS
jgi:transcription termination factor Rho